MKTIDSKNYRAVAAGLLVAVGIASTIATGGGGGGSTVGPTPTPPPTQTMLDITTGNAVEVTTTVVEAINLTFDIGDFTGGGVAPGVSGSQPLSAPDKGPGGVAMKPFPTGDAQNIESCANGGTVDITATLANPFTLTVGDTIRALFDNCDEGDGYILNGQIDLEVTRTEGDFLTELFLLGLDVIMTDIRITEGMETSTVDGDFALTLDTLQWPNTSQRMAGGELVFGVGNDTITLTGFDHLYQVGGLIYPGGALTVSVDGSMNSTVLGGSVDYETLVPVQAFGEADPHAGEVLITGDGGSTIRILFNDRNSITLEVDENGDGVIDEYIDTNWAALQGNTSEVNSSTAMRVAHEAVNIVAGFDSVAASAKAHFYASGVFGQLAQGGVSGTFESIEVNCPTAGAGLVSGNITVAGTFSQGDFVSAEFTNCVDQFDAVLNGPLDFTVSSYELLDPEVGLYRLDGDASMPCLERAAEGRTYVGCGDVETSYDGAAWPPGGIVTASSADFTVAFDDMDRYVSNATVRTATIIGPPWIMVDRSSSGSFGAPGLGGRYSYENTVPDTYMVDDDPATGPSGGVLKVTADDGSAVYIIAVDELNVRLEVDDDGDMLTDWSVWTTWAELY